MTSTRHAARSAPGLLAALAALASVLVSGCAQRRVYYAPQPSVVVVHHYGGYGAPPVVHVYHNGGYGYGGGQTVIHVHHYGSGYGGYGSAPIVVHHYHH